MIPTGRITIWETATPVYSTRWRPSLDTESRIVEGTPKLMEVSETLSTWKKRSSKTEPFRNDSKVLDLKVMNLLELQYPV